MNAVSRFFRSMIGKTAEGSYRGPAVGYTHWGNPMAIDFGDGFQQGLALATGGGDGRRVPIAYACVMQTARAISLCPAEHKRLDDGRMVTVTTSPASRLLRYPNAYQTWSQFIFNVVALKGFEGEAFVVITRDDRFAPNGLHLMPRGTCSPYVENSSGEVFYAVGDNPLIPGGQQYMVPARDVIHFRDYCPRHPLIGESPIKAAALALGVNVALAGHQAMFFSQMSRPSGVLSTDMILTRAQIQELRKAFDDQAAGLNSGKVPILGGGLKFSAMGISSQDAQLIEAQRMSVEEVARVYGIPLALVGDPSAPASNTEALINFWLATSLGSTLENLETSLERAFGLPLDEHIEFDVDTLLRTDLKTRMEAYAKAVQGGIYSPDEARAKENLPKVKGGDMVFMQRQMTPVDLLDDIARADLAAKTQPTQPATPALPAGQGNEETEPEEEEPPQNTDREADAEVTQALVHALIRSKRA